MTQGGDRKSSSPNGNLKNVQTSELVAKEVSLQNSNKSQELTIKSPPFLKSHDCYIDKFSFSCYNTL